MQGANQVAIVTGSTGVLGGAMARGLAKRGFRVVINGRHQDLCDKVALEIRNLGFHAIGIAADVTSEDDLKNLCEKVMEKYGVINVLVNAAGGNVANAVIQPNGSFFNMPIQALRQVMDLNLIGTVLPCILIGEYLVKSPGSCIVNISSMSAEKATISRVMGYSASKAAVENFTRCLAVELSTKYKDANIRVNALSPGFFIGDQNRALLIKEDGSLTSRGELIIQGTPMGRFGDPEDLIGPLCWLCSDDAKFVTGAIIPVDGGFSCYSGV